MSTVGFARCASYDPGDLTEAVRAVLEPLGGIAAFVRKGDRVLVKPNLVAPGRPDSGVCTHPQFVRAVCDIVAEQEPSRVFVGDLPGYNYLGETRRCREESGLAAALAGGPAEAVFLERAFDRVQSGRFCVYKRIDLSRDVAEADVVISLPKPKVHRLTLYTGAVKNLFGCVAYGTRAWLHRLGDYRAFCGGLVDIYDHVRPGLTIADAVRVRQGNGPCAGTRLDLGAVLASADGIALDAVGQFLLGFGPDEILTTTLARERGIGAGDLGRIRVDGPADWKNVRTAAARPDPLFAWGNFRSPKLLFRAAASFSRVRPAFDPAACDLCGLCAAACPAGALSLSGKSLRRNAKSCRLCFACAAACPRGAVTCRFDPFSALFKRKDEKSLFS